MNSKDTNSNKNGLQSNTNYNPSYNELFIMQKKNTAKIKVEKIKAFTLLYATLFTVTFGIIAIWPTFALEFISLITTITIVLAVLILYATEFLVLKFSKKINLLLKQQNELLDKLNNFNQEQNLIEATVLEKENQTSTLNANEMEASAYDNLLNSAYNEENNSSQLTKSANKTFIPKIIKAKRIAMAVILLVSLFTTLSGMVIAISEQYSLGLTLLILGSFGMFYAIVAYITTRLLKSIIYPFITIFVLLVLPIVTYALTEKMSIAVNAISTIIAIILGIVLFALTIYNSYTKPIKEASDFIRDNYTLLRYMSFSNSGNNTAVVFNKKQDRATMFMTKNYKIKVILEKFTPDNNNDNNNLTYEKLEERLFEVHNSHEARHYIAKKLIELYNLNDNRTIINFIDYDEDINYSNQSINELFEMLKQNPALSNKLTLQNNLKFLENGLISIMFNELLTISISHDDGLWFVMLYDYSFSNYFKENILHYINELVEEKYFFTQSKNGKKLNVHNILNLKKILHSKRKKYGLVFSAVKIYKK